MGKENSNNLQYLYEESASSLSTFSESSYGQHSDSENDEALSFQKNIKMEVDIEQTRQYDVDQNGGSNNPMRSSLSTLPQRLPQNDHFADDTENDSDHFDDEDEDETDDQENEEEHHALAQISENAQHSPLSIANKHHLRTPFA